jgi:hypothetical protein
MARALYEIPDFHPDSLVTRLKSILVFLYLEDRSSVSIAKYPCWLHVLNDCCSAVFGSDVDDDRSDDEGDENTKKN